MDSSSTVRLRSQSILKFFLLVFTLSLPFWLLGRVTEHQLLPGVPVAALMFVCPAIAAIIFIWREDKPGGVVRLLERALDFERIRAKIWYAPALLLMPCVTLLQYAWMRWMGVLLPNPHWPIAPTLAMALALLISALSEELGWSGYAIDPMQKRWGPLPASILLGCVWAIWHIVPLLQAHRPPSWIAWWSVSTVATRVVIVWLYNSAGQSVFAAAVFHAMGNLAWQLFPVHGSYFDPRLNGLLMTTAAVVVVVICGPRTLAGYKKPD